MNQQIRASQFLKPTPKLSAYSNWPMPFSCYSWHHRSLWFCGCYSTVLCRKQGADTSTLVFVPFALHCQAGCCCVKPLLLKPNLDNLQPWFDKNWTSDVWLRSGIRAEEHASGMPGAIEVWMRDACIMNLSLGQGDRQMGSRIARFGIAIGPRDLIGFHRIP